MVADCWFFGEWKNMEKDKAALPDFNFTIFSLSSAALLGMVKKRAIYG